jgi:hypothetical protein
MKIFTSSLLVSQLVLIAVLAVLLYANTATRDITNTFCPVTESNTICMMGP